MEETEIIVILFETSYPGGCGKVANKQYKKDGPLRSGQQINETQPITSEATLWTKSQPVIGEGSLHPPSLKVWQEIQWPWNKSSSLPTIKMKLLYTQLSPFFFFKSQDFVHIDCEVLTYVLFLE